MLRNATSFRITAPGKLILCGEHAVVYGKKAIASAINLRTCLVAHVCDKNASASASDDIEGDFVICDGEHSFRINEAAFTSLRDTLKHVQDTSVDSLVRCIQVQSDCTHQILDAVKLMLLVFGRHITWSDLSVYRLSISTEVPIAAGLGSSAALAVCLATFFLIVAKQVPPVELDPTSLKLINEHAFYIEKLFHGTPSGIDNYVATYGKYVSFEKGEHGAIIESFDSQLRLDVLVVNSGLPKRTLDQVNKVRRLHDRHPSMIASLLDSVHKLVESFTTTLRQATDAASMSSLNELIDINQGLLYALQVSNVELDRIVSLAREHKFSCKITGAGGGGCCYVLLNSNDQNENERLCELMKSLEANRFASFKTMLGCQGVRIENTD